jgi:hypothetical protein
VLPHFSKNSFTNITVAANWKSWFFFLAKPWPSSSAIRYQTGAPFLRMAERSRANIVVMFQGLGQRGNGRHAFGMQVGRKIGGECSP